MNQETTRILASRYEWISYYLEREAYRQQMAGRSKPLKHFQPCAKALCFTAAMYTETPSSVVIQRAAGTICKCHSDMDETELNKLYSQAVNEYPTLLAG